MHEGTVIGSIGAGICHHCGIARRQDGTRCYKCGSYSREVEKSRENFQGKFRDNKPTAWKGKIGR